MATSMCRLPASRWTTCCREQQPLRPAAPTALLALRPHSSGSVQLAALQQLRQVPRRTPAAAAAASSGGGDGGGEVSKRNTEFGYSRKDVVLIGVALTGGGYALYYGLQAGGMEAGYAGNWVQLIIFLGICVGWVGSYLYRVATKQMTYVKQLDEYEQAVMRKRLEEMPEGEVERMLGEVEADKADKERRRGGGGPQQ